MSLDQEVFIDCPQRQALWPCLWPALASLGSLLWMQTPKLPDRELNQNLHFNKVPRELWSLKKFEKTCSTMAHTIAGFRYLKPITNLAPSSFKSASEALLEALRGCTVQARYIFPVFVRSSKAVKTQALDTLCGREGQMHAWQFVRNMFFIREAEITSEK